MSLRDSWRLAVGTLTVLPVATPRRVDTDVTRAAMLVAPLAVVPLGAAVAGVGLFGDYAGLPALVTAVLAVATLALGSRAFHLDGLSDTVDGLTASYERERSLEVMKGGTAGPAGVVGLVVVLGLQIASCAGLFASEGGAVLAGVAVVVSRAALPLCCARGIPSARPDGLGGTYAGSVPRIGALIVWTVTTAALVVACMAAGLPWWRGILAAGVALVVLTLLLRRTYRRLGGVTGDVFGAAVELSLAALLVALS